MNSITLKNLRKWIILPLFTLMTLFSCQDEVTDITNPSQDNTIEANSTIANLISMTALNDGSRDNIIDFANCLEIELPVTVLVNGLEIIIDSEEDYDVIEAIFEEFEDDQDDLEIIFPITIISSDFTPIVIENQNQLEELMEECNDEDEEDDDIECIDFQYPISFSLFNPDFDVIETVTIENDEELYDFIADLDGSILASLNFPVTMILNDGSTVEVANNQELEAVIEGAQDNCDEDDDYDYDDDDNDEISVDDFSALLLDCSWEVKKLRVDNENLDDTYEDYLFTFYEDGTLELVDEDDTTYAGLWSIAQAGNSVTLNLDVDGLPDFNNDAWPLFNIHSNHVKIDFREGAANWLRIESTCDDEDDDDDDDENDCTESSVELALKECHWNIKYFNGSDDLEGFDLDFTENYDLFVYQNNATVAQGSWAVALDGDDIYLDLVIDFEDIGGDWKVVECDNDEFELARGEDTMELEQNCDEICNETTVDGYLLTCIWNVKYYNDSNNLEDYELDFNTDGSVTITIADSSITAMWSTSQTTDGVWLEFTEVNAPDIQAITGNWIITECDDDKLEMTENSNTMVLKQNCD